jgi:hypothetical protein
MNTLYHAKKVSQLRFTSYISLPLPKAHKQVATEFEEDGTTRSQLGDSACT